MCESCPESFHPSLTEFLGWAKMTNPTVVFITLRTRMVGWGGLVMEFYQIYFDCIFHIYDQKCANIVSTFARIANVVTDSCQV